MKKKLFFFFFLLFLISMAQAVTVTLTTASSLVTGHYSFAMDPITGKFYGSSNHTNHSVVNVYNNASAFASNTISSSLNLSSLYYNTYAVAYNGKLYARASTSDVSVGKWDLTTGTREATKLPFTNMSTDVFNWGGYSTVNWFYDGSSMYVLGKNTSGTSWQLNRMDTDLNVLETKSFTAGTLGYAIMLNGKMFTSTSYNSNTIDKVFDFATGTYTSVSYSLSGSSGAYWGDTFFDSTTDTIYMNSVDASRVYKINNASTVFSAPAPPSSVPEPGTWIALLIGLCVLIIAKKS